MIEYCQKWVLNQRRPIGLMSEADAARLHASRRPYWALVGGSSAPTEVISLSGRSAVVYFLDQDARPRFVYSFQELSPGKLFLSQISFHEYEAGGERPARTSVMAFSIDGSTEAAESEPGKREVVEKSGQVDVSSHWEEYPEFGSYQGILREERDRPEPN